MRKTGKMIIFAGAVAALSGAALLLNQMIRKKDVEEWTEQVLEEDDVDIEITMTAGDVDFEDEFDDSIDGDVIEECDELEEELEVVRVLPTGPKTARVRPTEEEEKEMLRKKLEHMIRF